MEHNSKSHYDEEYFVWQNSIGKFGGWANLTKFDNYIEKNHRVLEFGSGGGWLLNNIHCAEKMGVEINDAARSFALEHNKINSVKYVSELSDNTYDVIISNHALEHCHNPREELIELYSKLRSGGKIIFVVPCEGWRNKWKLNDINMHLYTWNSMTLGNLFISAGFNIISVEPFIHRWPPYYGRIAKFGRSIFNFCCKVYGRVNTDLTQIRVIAEKV